MIPLCNAQDVIDRLGGGAATRQLLDPTQTGSYDTSLLDGAISDATGDVEAALGARFAAITDATKIPAKIRRLTAELAVGYAWRRGPKNLAMPEGVKSLMADCRRELERLEKSETGPGNDAPASRLPTYIDNSDGGRRAVYDSFRRAGINGGALVLGVKFTLDRDGSLLRDIADRASELRPVLRQWGAYLRAGGKAKIAAGDFAPRAASTMAKYAATGTAAVTKQGKVRSSVAKKLDQALRRSGNEDARQALRTLLAGGTPTTSNRAVNRLRRRLDAAKKKLDSGGAVNIGKRKIERTKLLGKLANAFTARLQSAAVVVENAVKWSRVHNEGGRVGNGTTVPERRFLGISDEARRELADIALRWIVGGKD